MMEPLARRSRATHDKPAPCPLTWSACPKFTSIPDSSPDQHMFQRWKGSQLRLPFPAAPRKDGTELSLFIHYASVYPLPLLQEVDIKVFSRNIDEMA